MEFPFNINHLFAETITLVGNETKSKRLNDATYLNHLQTVIELLGKRSARAQQLTGSITTLHKTQLHGHQLYVLKDEQSNNGLGSVIGFIKVGRKRLFVLDHDGNHNELSPLCVLDFYVHESQQRKGCGLRLFKHMISKNNEQPCHLAVDRPSRKFISFLKKHFGLWATIPQVNNYVVFEGFFKGRKDYTRSAPNGIYNNRANNYSRPLSRAVSDSIIKRNRMAEVSVSEVLHGVRPYSGNNFNSYNNNRRKKWDRDISWLQEPFTAKQALPPRPNMYSRFSHQPSSALPAITSKHLTLPTQEQVAINDNRKRNSLQQQIQEKSFNSKHDTQFTENSNLKSAQVLDNQVPIKLFQCNQDQSIPKKQTYDMIAELKAKDEKSINQVIPPMRANQNWHNTQLRGIYSSWNIFGVPNTPATWHRK